MGCERLVLRVACLARDPGLVSLSLSLSDSLPELLLLLPELLLDPELLDESESEDNELPALSSKWLGGPMICGQTDILYHSHTIVDMLRDFRCFGCHQLHHHETSQIHRQQQHEVCDCNTAGRNA